MLKVSSLITFYFEIQPDALNILIKDSCCTSQRLLNPLYVTRKGNFTSKRIRIKLKIYGNRIYLNIFDNYGNFRFQNCLIHYIIKNSI